MGNYDNAFTVVGFYYIRAKEVEGLIESVKKACNILKCFSVEDPVLSNLEIAEKLELSPSTTHHIVKTLCREGVLIRDTNRKYRLGWQLMEWSNSVMYQQDIYHKALPFAKELTEKYVGTVHIGMYDKGDVVFVLRVSSKQADYVPTFLGNRKPAYTTSSGKVLLAFNRSYLQDVIAQGLKKHGPNTITEVIELKKELSTVKKQGFSISINENDTHTYAVAAPIQSYSGQTIASVNFVAPTSYMNTINKEQLVRHVINLSKELSREIGYIDLLN